ncbi:MAG: type II toxin-antitoxin system prevent-host-death family antitoxin [Desulfobacteraceae bacterium]|nr:MAG: type II toxin-antitoxin system prevent-host-death family antitoxin [Desulfobacteraceae bacterium]
MSELKARLSDYLNQVKSGAEVLITDRGKPVARIVPISGKKRLRQSLLKIEREGLLKLGTGKLPSDFWNMPRGKDPQGLALQALIQEREDGK